jgi:hypothetical protein
MQIRHAVCFCVALAAASTGACSSERDAPIKANPLATTDGFCTKWAEDACNETVVANCSATDAEACQAPQKAFCLEVVPSNGYSPDFAQECLDAVKTAYADAKLTREELGVVLQLGEPCDKLIKGAGEDGALCTDRSDCNTLAELECVKKAGEETGTCRIPRPVGGGFSCIEPDELCDDGFYCDGDNCLARKAEGRACASDDECVLEARCDVVTDLDAGTSTGTCVPRAELAQPCTQDADCKSNICTIGAAGSGRCVREVILSGSEPLCDNLR